MSVKSYQLINGLYEGSKINRWYVLIKIVSTNIFSRLYLVVDETNRESGKDSSTLPITTTELPTVISDEFNATESTGYNHTVAFNITLGVEVGLKIDPDTLK